MIDHDIDNMSSYAFQNNYTKRSSLLEIKIPNWTFPRRWDVTITKTSLAPSGLKTWKDAHDVYLINGKQEPYRYLNMYLKKNKVKATLKVQICTWWYRDQST